MAIDVNLQHVSINFTLKDHIYDVLREGILNVDIYEGDEDLRLDERQLAQQLGVSRTPICEAARLKILKFCRAKVFSYTAKANSGHGGDMGRTGKHGCAYCSQRCIHIGCLRQFAERHSVTASSAELSEYRMPISNFIRLFLFKIYY